MTLMLSTRLQVEEDSEMARDLVMKIFMKDNQPKSKSLDTSSNYHPQQGVEDPFQRDSQLLWVLRRMHLNKGKIVEIDADEDITLVDMETQVDLGAELQGWKDNDNAASKDVNAIEPTMFNNEEITLTMDQTLIKMKAKKGRLLDEQMAKRLHDKEVKQAATREKQEKDDLERAQVLQQQSFGAGQIQ
nr:hypothetical protein [Tanacetum cinerariifolium]